MPGLHDTAYPRFKKRIHRKELVQVYTPTREEVRLARYESRGKASVVCYLILLKTFQRLGYFVPLKQIPNRIIEHITKHFALAVSLIAAKKAIALDDLREMLVRRVNKIHKNARGALDTQVKQNIERTDTLVDTLRLYSLTKFELVTQFYTNDPHTPIWPPPSKMRKIIYTTP